jgi:hypothetical protein
MKRLFLLIIITALLAPLGVRAQGGAIAPTIGVTPAKFFETVQAGKAFDYTIKLRNLGSDSLPLAASVTDIDDISEEGVPIFAESVAKRSAAEWITLGQEDVIVNPGETREVKYNLTVPSDAAPGGYTAAIIFQAQLPSYYFDLDASTRVLPAVSVLAFFTVAGQGEITVDQVSIEQLRVPPIVVSTPISVIANVKNGSNFFVQTDAEATIQNVVTKRISSSKLGTVILLPEKSRRFVAAFENSFLPGIYSASINFKQGDKTLVGAVKFVAIPWPFIIVILLLGIFALGIAGRRRFKHAWAVLRGKDIPQPTRTRRPMIR